MSSATQIPSHTRSEGFKTGAEAAMELLREQIDAAYQQGFSDGYKAGEAEFKAKVVAFAQEFNILLGKTDGATLKGRAIASAAIAHGPHRRKPVARAAPGAIERAISAVFSDGKRRTIKEMHDAITARGETASREGVARILRLPGKYQSDGSYYFPNPPGVGEAAAGDAVQANPQPSSSQYRR